MPKSNYITIILQVASLKLLLTQAYTVKHGYVVSIPLVQDFIWNQQVA